jgi:hypothetical protein
MHDRELWVSPMLQGSHWPLNFAHANMNPIPICLKLLLGQSGLVVVTKNTCSEEIRNAQRVLEDAPCLLLIWPLLLLLLESIRCLCMGCTDVHAYRCFWVSLEPGPPLSNFTRNTRNTFYFLKSWNCISNTRNTFYPLRSRKGHCPLV